MPEKLGASLYNEQPEPQARGAGSIRPVKSPENLVQLIAWDADAVVADLEVHPRTAAPAGNEHAPTARRVVNRVAHQVSHHPGQQNRLTKNGTAGRHDAKANPLQSGRLGELQRELCQHRTERYR